MYRGDARMNVMVEYALSTLKQWVFYWKLPTRREGHASGGRARLRKVKLGSSNVSYPSRLVNESHAVQPRTCPQFNSPRTSHVFCRNRPHLHLARCHYIGVLTDRRRSCGFNRHQKGRGSGWGVARVGGTAPRHHSRLPYVPPLHWSLCCRPRTSSTKPAQGNKRLVPQVDSWFGFGDLRNGFSSRSLTRVGGDHVSCRSNWWLAGSTEVMGVGCLELRGRMVDRGQGAERE